MVMTRPTSQEAYVDLVQQAVIEAEELRSSIEYDEEYMGGGWGSRKNWRISLNPYMLPCRMDPMPSLIRILNSWLSSIQHPMSGFPLNRC